MNRAAVLSLLSLVMLALLANDPLTGSTPPALGVRSVAGELIKVFDQFGTSFVVRHPDGSLAPLAGDARLLVGDIESSTGNGTGAPVDPTIHQITHEDPDKGIRVEPDGRVVPLESEGTSGATTPGGDNVRLEPMQTPPPTIDRMTTGGWYYESFQPGGTVGVLGHAVAYFLSDGTSWESGAGSYRRVDLSVNRVEVSGEAIRYVLNPSWDGILYQQTDFDSGEHSSQGMLGVAGPLVIEAIAGSTTGILRGQAEIVSNDATYYGDRFNYFSSPVGAVVPFEVAYTLHATTWTPDIFSTSFSYSHAGVVDFAHPISVPKVTDLAIAGSAQVPTDSSVQFFATVRYENAVWRNVTDLATWSVEPASLVSIDGGLLFTGSPDTVPATLILHATYEEGGIQVEATRAILMVARSSADLPETWEMYQADSRHSGWLPVNLEPDTFEMRWQRTIGSGRPLNPVTAAGGRVFVSQLVYFDSGDSLFALDARDGATLWSKEFDDVFSVNPPSYAYGNVYVQTGNHSNDTWLRAYDAANGEPIFQVPHAAQWERYFAPTIFNGTVYVNGGYYGGMYAFDAFSGQQRWFRGLPQYDEWTPAVDATYAYAYVGEHSPGLHVFDRLTGASAYTIPDPNFDWNGWDMDLAPVLGGAHNVLAIHDGRLISFDTASRTIRWEIAGGFAGQPSVAHGVIFAIRNGALVVLDEETGAQAWSWSSPGGALSGALIVTETHVIAGTANATFAIDLRGRVLAWSNPAGGHLALSDDMLYIASANGVLTAVSLPGFTPARLVKLEIAGPSEVVENSTTQFSAMAHYDDGRVRDRTLAARWSIDPAPSAAIDTNGLLTMSELFTPDQRVTIRATYEEYGVTVAGEKAIDVVIGVTLDQFILRNLAGARDVTQHVLDELRQALLREEAARAVLQGAFPDGESGGVVTPSRLLALNDLVQAMQWARIGRQSLDDSLRELQQSMMRMNQGSAAPAGRALRIVDNP